MRLKEDIRSIFRELSPIIAGFKLAIVVISWFGFGSVASWIIAHWYPFSRRMWDSVAALLSIPSFPNVVKDSLTALVFFLPIGISALINRSHVDERNSHITALGAFFGIAFLFVICWDVLATLFEGMRTIAVNDTNPFLIRFILFTERFVASLSDYKFYILVPLIVVYMVTFAWFINLYRKDFNKFTLALSFFRFHFEMALKVALMVILGLVNAILILNFIFVATSAAFEILIATVIFLLILIFLLAAIAFTPKKLFLATGAAIAFIFSAACFEAVVVLRRAIEGSI